MGASAALLLGSGSPAPAIYPANLIELRPLFTKLATRLSGCCTV